eukprot:1190952-Prorocentrum_minimum.AAC.2
MSPWETTTTCAAQELSPSKHASRGPRGEQWEKVGNWTQGEKRGRVSGVLRAPLPLLAEEDPKHEVIF